MILNDANLRARKLEADTRARCQEMLRIAKEEIQSAESRASGTVN